MSRPASRPTSRHRKAVVGAASGAVALAVVLLVPTGGAVARSAVRAPDPKAPARAAPARHVTAPAVVRRSTHPRRVLLVGDSMMVGAKDAIATDLAPYGIETHFVGKEGTGLLTRQMGWLDLIRQEVATWNPDVVVIESCCNYATGPGGYYRLADGTAIVPDSKRMYQAWEVAARAAIRVAARRGAAVSWVLTPPASPALYGGAIARRIDRLNEIYRRLGVPLIDWRGALTTDGTFAAFLADPTGHPVRVRTYDGLHLTPAGDRRVASAVTRALTATVAHAG